MAISIIIKPHEVLLGLDANNNAEWLCIDSISWHDMDPFVILEIPGCIAGSGAIKQQIKPCYWEVTVICTDADSLHTILYATAVNADGDFAVDEATGERATIGYFLITGEDHAGVERVYNLTGAIVRTREMDAFKEGTVAKWIVTFLVTNIEEVFA